MTTQTLPNNFKIKTSYLKILETIHHQGLRLALEAFSISLVKSLYLESNEPPLYDKR